jgi:uncharacterized membrane protein
METLTNRECTGAMTTSTLTRPAAEAALTGSLPITMITLAAIGSGIVGGVLYAFSAFVMQGIDQTPPASAVAVMQGINRTAVGPPLMVPLMGTLLICLALLVVAVSALRSGHVACGVLVLVGCALYLTSFTITGAYHVPHNDALARIDPTGSGAAAAWRDYYGPWVRMNHLRVAAAVGASVCFWTALVKR